jgi:hypothetical protein
MPTIHQEWGFRFCVYTRDHWPPHVHVEGKGGHAVFYLSPVECRKNRGYSRRDLRTIEEIVRRNVEYFLECWARIHG